MANNTPTNGLPIANWSTANLATTLEAFQNKYQYWPELRNSMGQDILLTDLITLIKGNGDKFIPSESFDVFVENPPYRTMTIGATVSGGATNDSVITFTIADTDCDTYWNYYPRVHQSFIAGSAQFPVEMVITSITPNSGAAPTITAEKRYTTASTANTAWVPADFIKAGMTFALIPAVNAAQGTGATTGTKIGYKKETFYSMLFKDSLGWENAELARAHWDVLPSGGQLYAKELARMDANLDMAMEIASWVGQTTDNASWVQTTLSDGSSVSPPGTKGIWHHIKDNGYSLEFSNATDFTMDDFYEIAEYGESVGLPSGEWLFSHGGDLGRRIEKTCTSFITQATGSLNQMFTPDAGGGMKDLTVGYRHIIIGGQTFILHKNHTFSNPLILGLPGYGFNDAAAVFPLGNARTKEGFIPNVSLFYRGIDGYHERKRVFAPFLGVGGPRGMVGGPTVLEGDISKVHALTDWGLAFLESWRGVIVYNTSIVNNAA